MGLSITTIAASTRLTTVAVLEGLIGNTSDDALLAELIDQASAAIVTYCHRPFARETYSESLAGFGGIRLQLARTPVVSVTSVIDQDGNVITDYSIEDADRGWLYRRAGWLWSVQTYPGLSGGGRFMDWGSPQPRQEEPHYTVAYRAGYLMPVANRVGAITISAAVADNSFNDSAAGFSADLRAGDPITASDFTNLPNNGRFTIVSATASKIVVSGGPLVNEAAGTARTINAQTLPKDVEKACIEAVKAWYLDRAENPNTVEKQVGSLRLRNTEGGSTVFSVFNPLPAVCVGLLQPWVRAA